MLDKNTLIKRFEETTKQEIINHNRAIAGSNSAIGCLRNDLKALQKKFLDHVNVYQSHLQKQESNKMTQSECTLASILNAESKANDAIHCSNTVGNAHNELNQVVRELSVNISACCNRLVTMSNEIYVMDECFGNLKTSFFNELERVKNVFTDRHEAFIKEVSIKPKELDLLEEILSYKIDEIRVNQSCTHDELEIVKKDVKYMQKQIENIYTLLERKKVGDQ